MKVFGTEMLLITFVFGALECIMLLLQIVFWLQNPKDKLRRYYITLLIFLIVYNITGGLFPDENLSLSIRTQNILAYGGGFMVGIYLPFYFYKVFNLKKLRFYATYGTFLFFILPYLVFFGIEYSITGNLTEVVNHGLIIPSIYAGVLLWVILREIRKKYITKENLHSLREMWLTYAAIIPWVSLPIFSIFNVGQFVEVAVMNMGFFIITILFIKNTILSNRSYFLDPSTHQQLNEDIFLNNIKYFTLTQRETDIAQLILNGLKYKEIANQLFISERTVNKHVQNIFLKVSVSNKTDLIQKLTHNSR